MNAIPLLVVASSCAAVVEINGAFAGEVGAGYNAVSLPVSHTGSVYVSLLPLGSSRGAQIFPVTRKLVFKGGELSPPNAEGGMTITRWPGGVFALELEPGRFEEPPAYSYPFTVASMDWRDARATLFYENGLHLLVEDAKDTLLLGHTLHTKARNGILFPRRAASGEDLLFAHMTEPIGERLLCVACLGGRYEVVFERSAEGFTVADDGRVNCVNRLETHLRHEQRSAYALSGREYVRVSSEPARRTRKPVTREDTVIAFIEAVKHGFEHEALGYLSKDLAQSIDFSDILEFMGDFENWARPLYGTPVEENCVYIGIRQKTSETLFDARLFKFELDDSAAGRIENFKEL